VSVAWGGSPPSARTARRTSHRSAGATTPRTNPWRPRGVEVRGRAEALDQPALIRIHPERIVSWGIESEAIGDRHARGVR
jgi:hypothetical protein